MTEADLPQTRRLVLRSLLQVGAAGAIGALLFPIGMRLAIGAAWGGDATALLFAVLFLAVFVVALLALARLLPDVSRLTRTPSGQFGWALTVALAGTVAWYFAFSVYVQVQPELMRNPMLSFPRSAVPCALVAALLLRPWYVKLTAAALTVAAGLGLLVALAATTPAEVDERLAALHADRDQYFVTEVPGLSPVPHQNFWYLQQTGDPATRGQAVAVYAYPDAPNSDCTPAPLDTIVASTPCTAERPGLTYTAGTEQQEYYYRKGTVLLRVVGSRAVDRDVLRTATLAARPATDAEVLTMLPPGSVPHRTFMGHLRDFARRVFG